MSGLLQRIVLPSHPSVASLFELEDEALEILEGAPIHLSIRGLVTVAALCIQHVRPRASRSTRAELDRLAGLVARHLGSPEGAIPFGSEAPWQRDLHAARTIAEHSRGALKVAAIAAQIGSMELMSGGREASRFTADAIHHTTRTLRKDPPALVHFLETLAETLERAALAHPTKS